MRIGARPGQRDRDLGSEETLTQSDSASGVRSASSAGRHRARRVGTSLGILLVFSACGYWVFDRTMTPAVPRLDSASVAEVVSFVVDRRGLMRMSRFEQEEFLDSWKKYYSDDARQRVLKQHLDQCDESTLRDLRDVLFRVSKRMFLTDAQEYLRIKHDSTRAYAFLADRLARFAAEAAWLKGYGDPAKDLSVAIGTGAPRNPEEWSNWIVRETTPEERVLGEQYLEAIKNVREQEKRRRSAAAPASGPAASARGP